MTQTLVLVNGPASSGLAERAVHIGNALTDASVLYRDGGRAGAIGRFLADIRRLRPQLIYGIDNSVPVLIAALFARVVCGARFVLDTGDAVGPLRAKMSRLDGVCGWVLERFGYSLAELVVARSHGLAERIERISKRPTVVVPDGFDDAKVPEADGEAARARWGCGPGTLVIGVIGSAHWNAKLQWCYGRDVIEAVAQCKRRDCLGALIVRGDGVEHLRRLALRLGVAGRVVIEDPLPGYAVYEQIRGFDIGLSTQTNDAVGQCRTTGKLIQYIAAGVYVLASRVGEAARILPERMTVPYEGAWDDAYFARLAERIDAAPSRMGLRVAGAGLRSGLAQRYAYSNLTLSLRELRQAGPERVQTERS